MILAETSFSTKKGDTVVETWLPAAMKDKERKVLWAASGIIETKQIPLCPICEKNLLRFYYREFGIVQIPRWRGTIWVWCQHCGIWDHISGAEPDQTFAYDDPLSTQEFEKIDTPFIVLRLNELWEQGTLPRTVKSFKED